MKKFRFKMFGLIAVVIITASMIIAPQAASAYAGGTGTSGDPYLVSNCVELQSIADEADTTGLYFLQTQAIDCSATSTDATWGNTIDNSADYVGFVPIGLDSEFDGEYDGAGFTINNLFLESNGEYGNGVFGYTDENSLITDVHLRNVDVADVDGGEYTGALVGYHEYGVVEFSSATGTVSGEYGVGGLVGYNYAAINDSWADVTVSAGDSYYAGGLVGSHNSGGAPITRSYAFGDVSASSDAGGFVGENGGEITESFSTGNVITTGENAGGFVGANGGDISQSFSEGNATGEANVGGFVGITSGAIVNAYARGNATATDSGSSSTGGFEGFNNSGDTQKAYTTGIATGGTDPGAFMGSDEGYTHDDNFYDGDIITIADNGAATPKTTAEMKTESTFTDVGGSTGLDNAWDFDTIWIIDEHNDGYPHFQASEDYFDSIVEEPQSTFAYTTETPTGERVYIQWNSNCDLEAFEVKAEVVNEAQDLAFEYPNGLVNFTLQNCEDSEVTINLYYVNVTNANYVLRKFTPSTLAYTTITPATLVETTLEGQQAIQATYTITDNGALDLDPTVGVITDPAGIAIDSLGAPRTGGGGTAK